MKIKSIYVNNFKSLVDFKIDLADFNCLVGLNGSGKSTFLQFMSFLSQLMKGNLDSWLERREWKRKDISNSVNNKIKKYLSFRVTFLDEDNSECTWRSNFNFQHCQCRSEFFSINDRVFQTFKLKDSAQRIYRVENGRDENKYECRINFQYTGSIFSSLKDPTVPKVFYEFRDYIKNIETVDLLAPQSLRHRSRESHGSIGPGGEYLSALLYELGKEKNREILNLLKTVYPTLSSIEIKQLRAGWKQLEIGEQFQSIEGKLFDHVKTESRHINDGLLRMIGFLSQLKTKHKFLLFDEIENGINTELIGFLLKQLLDCGKQIVVTTHSPMILNYLDDKTAIPGVHFFYKTPEGHTQCVPFLSIPSMREKLEVMGPGEAFIDTDLTALSLSLTKNNFAERKGA
jgi:predicted ATPase